MTSVHILSSARRHGFSDDDIAHALDHAIRHHDLEDGDAMIIGPTPTGELIEVGITVDTQTVFHAMSARNRFL